jgi:DNA processing protein
MISSELEALMALRLIGKASDRSRARALREAGSASRVLSWRRERIRSFLRVETWPAGTRSGARARARDSLERCARAGIGVTGWGLPDYPVQLTDLCDPPAVLFYRGRLELSRPPVVAIVGARKCSAYGRRVAERLGSALAGAGITVASGMALGIDASAHEGAVDRAAGTVAVLGSGVDVPSPSSNRSLYGRICARGLVCSDFLPGQSARPFHFPKRNRLVAALGAAVVVVEAGSRSGALITVDHALDIGRSVFAVPGPIDRATSAGTNRLLSEGAHPVTDPESLIEEVAAVAGFSVNRADQGAAPPATLGRDPLAVWQALGDDGKSTDNLVSRAGLDTARTIAALSTLEVEGWVRRVPGGRYERAPGRGHLGGAP